MHSDLHYLALNLIQTPYDNGSLESFSDGLIKNILIDYFYHPLAAAKLFSFEFESCLLISCHQRKISVFKKCFILAIREREILHRVNRENKFL